MGAATQAQSAPAIGEAERQHLIEAVNAWNDRYDPQEKMIRRPFSSPGYHTTLKGGQVHPTRDSLTYAVALLDTGVPEYQKRAEDILRKVISLQDQDPQSRTYGIWSWFLEEPLNRMSPPDWNWADFCGVQLLQVALFHRERLPSELMEKVDAAIRHAAKSIQRRNVGPGYTNIAIMGTYVTLIAGELFELEDLRNYGMNRLRRFHAYTQEQGAFTEYNSPTYTVVALQEIGRVRLHAKDPEARRLAEEIYRLAWEEIAQHFHPPTRQWAGPHSRCYNTLLPTRTLAFIQRATEGRVRLFENDEPHRTPDEYRLPLPCPKDFEHFFARLDQPRELIKTFVKKEFPVIGTTWLTPEFALGSVNRRDLWNQRRSLIAYWGTAEKPAYLHVRFLHDGYDFAAAQLFSAQKKGVVLAGVAFGTDGGDTHVSLDRLTNGLLRARDLRLRFEFGGVAGTEPLSKPGSLKAPLSLAFDKIRLELQVPFARFGRQEGRWDTGTDPARKTGWLDVVLYEGEVREFKLGELDEAALAFCLQIRDGKEAPVVVAAEPQERSFRLKTASPALELRVPTKPAKVGELQRQRL